MDHNVERLSLRLLDTLETVPSLTLEPDYKAAGMRPQTRLLGDVSERMFVDRSGLPEINHDFTTEEGRVELTLACGACMARLQ